MNDENENHQFHKPIRADKKISKRIPGEGLIKLLKALCVLGIIIGVFGSLGCFTTHEYAMGVSLIGATIGSFINYFFFKYLVELGYRIKDLEKELHDMRKSK